MPQKKSRYSQSGNVFFALFAAVGMVGVLGASMNTVMRGPVTSMATVTKRTIAENNVIASGKLAIVSATTQQPDSGDCDADSYVEPIPYRNAGASPHPTGGGFIPTSIGASLTDPWQLEYGYCAWDHGAVTVSDNDAGCGGSGANRLEGAPSDTQMAIAIISAGPDMVFQTQCNAFVDANVDTVPDVALVAKPGGSDDIVLGHTYAEANMALGGLWGLKSGAPDTATIAKDIEVDGDASFGGSLILGGGLLLPDQTTSGACAEANDQQLRRNTAGPSLEICIWGGGPGAWVPMGGAGAISGLTAAGGVNTIDNLAHAQTWNWNSATNGTGLALGSNSLTSGSLLSVTASNAASTGNAIFGTTNATGANATAIRGVASGASGANYGVAGTSASTSGTGVSGVSSGASGTTYGLYGSNASPTGYGAYGVNSAAAGTGVAGVANSGAATGVLGSTSSTTNAAAAVKGTASGASGATYGVLGSNASAAGFGVAGTSTASAGTGVWGVANTGAATGVLGATSSTTNGAAAVKGTAGGATGDSYGGYFSSASSSGYGVYATSPGWAVYGTSASGGGVFGSGGSTGVYGTGSTYGVSGMTAGATGNAVYGMATHTTGTNVGVYGGSMSTGGYGGLFQGSGATGWGVYSYGGTYGVQANTGNSGVNYGISAATGSANGYAGYFDNTNGAGGWGIFTADDLGIGAGKYLNWGATRGTGGYGIWDDAGVMKVKNSGGSWTAIAGGAETDPQVGTLTNTKWCTTNGTVIDCTSDAPGGGGGTPGGANTQVQFNNGGAFGGSANLTWNDSNRALTISGTMVPVVTVTATTANAVNAESTATSGGTDAVFAKANSPNRAGIRATNPNAAGYGGYFEAGQHGMYAEALTTSGYAVGAYGKSSSPDGYGVLGQNFANTGNAYGGHFTTGSTGTGVFGQGFTGVRGQSIIPSGVTHGVYGTSASSTGYAGYFDNTASGWGLFSADDVGITAGKYLNWGATMGTGGYGIRDNAGTIECKNSGGAWAACAGGGGGTAAGSTSQIQFNGGSGTFAADANLTWDGRSVIATNTTVTPSLAALRGNSTGTGAFANYGVYGSAASSSGYGVYGTSSSATGYAGYFDNSASGWGLYSADDAGLAASKYLNWGATRGSTGYGIRDNAGTIECKNSGGAWAACAGGGGGTPAGLNTEIQFNNSGSFGSSANLTWSGGTLYAVGPGGGEGIRGVGTYIAVRGRQIGTNGYGLYGDAASSTGTVSGVFGTTASPSGYGGFFTNTGNGFGVYSTADVGIGASKYLNFGATQGTSGYGIRDNGGTIEVKNSGGAWAAPGGAETDPQVGTLTNTKWCTSNGTVVNCTSDAPSGGGSDWTLISSQSAIGSSTVSWTGINYEDLLLVFINLGQSSGSNQNFNIKFSTNNGSSYSAGSTFMANNSTFPTGFTVWGSMQMTGAKIGFLQGNSTYAWGGNATTYPITAQGNTSYGGVAYGPGAQINALQIVCATCTFSAGTLKLYGR